MEDHNFEILLKETESKAIPRELAGILVFSLATSVSIVVGIFLMI